VSDDQGQVRSWIDEGARLLDVPLSDEALHQLGVFTHELMLWNRKINLVARCETRELIDRHLHDSLGFARLLDRPELAQQPGPWHDIGTGAGLPGLPLAIARPDTSWVLVEPIGKKVAFLRHVVSSLHLDNVQIVQGRSEALLSHSIHLALSRATFPPQRWLEVARELLSPGGMALVTMGAGAPEEVLRQASFQDVYQLPFSSANRVNVVVRR